MSFMILNTRLSRTQPVVISLVGTQVVRRNNSAGNRALVDEPQIRFLRMEQSPLDRDLSLDEHDAERWDGLS